MSQFGDATDLAAVAIASMTFSFLYWAFGFLRMSTTGLAAQATGAGDPPEAAATLVRALAVGGLLGILLVLLFPWLEGLAIGIFQGSAEAEARAQSYLWARIPGAPAALMGFGVSGWLLGTGRTRSLLLYQVVLNSINAGLDSLFVSWGWGPAGIGAGTAIAEWIALGVGLVLVRDGLRGARDVYSTAALRTMVTANRDVAIRTLSLLFGFGWFVNAGAMVGTANLAGNQILLQFTTVAAFVLDSFAFVAEKEVGEAVGARDADRLRRAVRLTTQLALVSGALFSALFWITGAWILQHVADPAAREAALAFLPFCAAVPLLGVPAYQLDGVFLGATRGKALRSSAVISTCGYVLLDCLLRPTFGNTGVWTAFLAMYVLRALTLGSALPALMRDAGHSPLGMQSK